MNKSELQDWCDLMVDEFLRIKACPHATEEIKGLCERAISGTKQRVPIIEQRDHLLGLKRQLDSGFILFGNEGYSPEFYEIVEIERASDE